jgi:hypothetical protein
MPRLSPIPIALLVLATPALAQSHRLDPRTAPPPTAADSAGIRAAALDYIDGWYAGDGARMRRALHPELAKRSVMTDPASGRTRFIQMSALSLIMGTEHGGGSNVPESKRRHDVTILDIYGKAAIVRVDASSWVDYMQLGLINGKWVIINVLWEDDPPEKTPTR